MPAHAQGQSTIRVDPITFEVVRSSFDHITRLMSTNLQKTSYSPILYDMVDFSNALFDPECQLIGQTTNVPVHLAAMHHCARACVEKFGRAGLHEGDVAVLNDPYSGGTHIPDITFTMPIYYEGELLCFAGSRGHWTDLGGAAPGGMVAGATHIVEEGLRIPPVKIFEGGKPVAAVIDILRANSRTPYYIDGDLRAHLSALKTAERYMRELVAKYGPGLVKACMAEALDYVERRMRRAIAAIPPGTYSAADYVDCDGVSEQSVVITVTLRVQDEAIEVDFTGTAPLTAGPINYPVAGLTGGQ